MQQSKAIKYDEYDTAAFKIFHKTFECMVRQVDLYDMDYIETRGLVTTGDAQLDDEIAQSKVRCGKTIAALAEMYDEGINIELVDHGADAPTIYELVIEHVDTMARYIEGATTIAMMNERLERQYDDLVKMERLAYAVYPIAHKVSQIQERQTTTGITKMLRKKASDKWRPVGAKAPEQKPIEEAPELSNDSMRTVALGSILEKRRHQW